MKSVKATPKAAKAAKSAKFRPKTDRRILHTRDALGDALVALIQEKIFDEITVQDVLDRAQVGRSTFYVHYRDKQDLFLSDVEDFLQSFSTMLDRQDPSSKRLLPVQEFFVHVRDVRHFYAALVRSGKVHDVQALARGFFARSIEQRLQRASLKLDPLQRSAQAHALAGSFFSLLDWWIDKNMTPDPQAMDALFHRLAWRGLSAPSPQPLGQKNRQDVNVVLRAEGKPLHLVVRQNRAQLG